jgi:hypothetical protein
VDDVQAWMQLGTAVNETITGGLHWAGWQAGSCTTITCVTGRGFTYQRQPSQQGQTFQFEHP